MPPPDAVTTPRPAAPASQPGVVALPQWAPFAIIALIWLPALLRYSVEWSINPQYYYGWSVPLLAAYLIYDRWPSRPNPEPVTAVLIPTIVIVLLILPQLPLRIIGEANTDWRMVSWIMGAMAFGISLTILYVQGGWRWMTFFVLPILFLLTAIPWPRSMEVSLVQGLMQVNAQLAANLVGFVGIPAEARGNVIEVATGILGVNEACSGIRSLQSTLMASMFLGILYRRSLIGLIGLVAAGSAIAFVCNVIRTTFLTYQGAKNGIEAVDEWHDTAGFAILGVVLVCLWAMSQWLERSERKGFEQKGAKDAKV